MGHNERSAARKPRAKARPWREGDRARVTHTQIVFDVAYVSRDGATIGSCDDGRRFVASFCERVDDGRSVNDSPAHFLDGLLPP